MHSMLLTRLQPCARRLSYDVKQAALRAGGHVGGEDVVRVAVKVLAGPVVTHGDTRVGVPGGDLDVAKIHSSVKTGRHERMPEHMRMRPGDPHTRLVSEPPESPGSGMTVHARPAAVKQNRPGGPATDSAVDSSSGRWWQRDQDDLAALAAHSQHPVAVLFAEVGDIRAGGFEDPQAQQAEHGHEGGVVPVGGLTDWRGGGSGAPNSEGV